MQGLPRTLSRIEAGKGKPRYPDSAQRNSENWAPLQGAHPSATIWQHQVDMTDTKRRGDLEQRGYCWIATTSLKPAQVLLGKAAALRQLLLCQPLVPPYAGEIPSDKAAHVHSRSMALVGRGVYQLWCVNALPDAG